MPLSFPSSPSVNQTSTQNGRTYKWTGSVWEFVSSGGGGSGLSWSSVPASATASGTAGQIAYDANYFYVAVGNSQWERAALSTWGPVTSIAGLQLWLDAGDAGSMYDATSGGSLVAADGAVARWEDKSGNNRHATQGTSGSRPLRKASVQGGRDVLRFDGTSDFMTVPSSAAAFTFLHSAQATVFVVVKVTDQADGIENVVIDTNGGDTLLRGYNLSWQATSDAVYAFVTNGGSRSAWGTHNNAFTPGGFSLTTVITDITNGTAVDRTKMRKNGGSPIAGDNIYTNNGSSSDSTYDMSLGRGNGGAGHVNGDIAEIIIYDSALSDTDRASVENFLISKWHIT